MKGNTKQIVFLLVCVAILGVIAAFIPNAQAANPPKYTLYCGLNDADAGAQILSVEQAREMAREIIIKRGCGYTEYVAYGAYQEGDKVIGNDTLVYELFFVDTEMAEEIAKAICTELNLTPILMEKGGSDYKFS